MADGRQDVKKFEWAKEIRWQVNNKTLNSNSPILEGLHGERECTVPQLTSDRRAALSQQGYSLPSHPQKPPVPTARRTSQTPNTRIEGENLHASKIT